MWHLDESQRHAVLTAFEEWRCANRSEGEPHKDADALYFYRWLSAKRADVLALLPEDGRWQRVAWAVRRAHAVRLRQKRVLGVNAMTVDYRLRRHWYWAQGRLVPEDVERARALLHTFGRRDGESDEERRVRTERETEEMKAECDRWEEENP